MSTQPGYQAPRVTVAATLGKRASAAVLIVPVVSGDDGSPAVLDGGFLDAGAISEIEVALKALGAKGGAEQLTRLLVPSLPVASVLAVGLGAPREEWPAELIRRAAGVAARSLNGVAAVIITLSELHLEAAVEGLILGSYQMHEFRSTRTAPKEPMLTKITALSTARNAKSLAARAVAVASAVATARDLVNTPPSHLHPAEFAAGHIPHARNVPAAQVAERLKEFEKYKAKPVIVHCRNGQRSGSATNAFRKAGFNEAVKLRDGLTAWEQANLPIQKGAKG